MAVGKRIVSTAENEDLLWVVGLRKGSGVCDRPEKERNMIKTESKTKKMHNILAEAAISIAVSQA